MHNADAFMQIKFPKRLRNDIKPNPPRREQRKPLKYSTQ